MCTCMCYPPYAFLESECFFFLHLPHPSLFICEYLYVYLSIYIFIFLSISISDYVHFCLSLPICLSTYLYFCLSVCLSIYTSIFLSIYLFINLFTYVFACIYANEFVRAYFSILSIAEEKRKIPRHRHRSQKSSTVSDKASGLVPLLPFPSRGLNANLQQIFREMSSRSFVIMLELLENLLTDSCHKHLSPVFSFHDRNG